MNLKSFFPIYESFQSHTPADWRKDLIAGITVAVMLVPQGMAYALLAGIPPIYGLYGGLVPLLIYAFLGSSRQLSIGPVAVSALLVLAGISQIADPMTAEYINLVIVAGVLIGIVQFTLGLFRLGFLVNFISHPVIVGFTSAAAIIIAVSQFKDLLGFHIPRFSHSFETAKFAFANLDQVNFYTLFLCLGSILLMFSFKKISKSIPGPLIVVLLGTLIAYFIGIDKTGFDIVGSVPEGLPGFQLPNFEFDIGWEKGKKLLGTVFTVTVIGIVESIGIAKVLQAKHGNYQIRPNQEFLALGLSKIAGSFFQALPTSGSFTRSAVNNDSGAVSGIASLITALIIGLTLLFLTPLFYFLPKAVLAAIILLSVLGLFDWKEIKHLWKNYKSDFFMMLATFLITLIFGIEEGVFSGVILSIIMVLYKSSRPHVAELGKLPDSDSYGNIQRFKSAIQSKDILIFRFDDQLYFGNSSYFQDSIYKLVNERKEDLRLFILVANSMHIIDSTGYHALEDVLKFLKKRNIEFYISGMIGPVRDKATRCGFMKKMDKHGLYLNVNKAISHFRNLEQGIEKDWSPDAIQTNFKEEN